jgi:segregation and condensation protein B
MVTLPQFGPHLKALYKSRMKERLTRPSLETLAIIAYKQPVTKPEIEAIRGVNTDGVIITLLERNLIRITGRKDTVGRPLLYGTTDEFLQHFGLGSLSDMPKLPEMQQMTEAKDDAVQTS